MLKLSAFALAALFVFPPMLLSQSPATPVSSAQAVTYAAQAMAALIGTAQVSDATLTGTAVRTAGSDVESGTATLKLLGTSDTRLDLSLPSGTTSEVRNSANGPGGFWIDAGGVSHDMAAHNCLTDAAWFFPAFSSLSQLSNSSLVATYVGQETKNGAAVQHLNFASQLPASVSAQTAAMYQALTTEDIYLDASSFLPVAINFNTHPDNDELTNIPVEIDFSNYQAVNGVNIPFHIQKFFNGTLYLDITVQSAVLNSGLSASTFTAN